MCRQTPTLWGWRAAGEAAMCDLTANPKPRPRSSSSTSSCRRSKAAPGPPACSAPDPEMQRAGGSGFRTCKCADPDVCENFSLNQNQQRHKAAARGPGCQRSCNFIREPIEKNYSNYRLMQLSAGEGLAQAVALRLLEGNPVPGGASAAGSGCGARGVEG